MERRGSTVRVRQLRGRPGGRYVRGAVFPEGALVRPWVARVLAVAWLVAVVCVSIAAGARPGWVRALAASPDRVREGKLWFLVSSAVLVDRPVVLSLLSFAVLATLALTACGTRTFWWSAILGQVLATLLVYVFIVAARRIVAGAFDASLGSPDYGVSAISAAWLGSIATVAWRRRGRSRVGKLSISLSCLAVGLFAYSVRPDVTVLSSEHLVAFALGVAAAVPGLWTRVLDITFRRPLGWTRALNPITGAMLILVPLMVAITAAPIGLAALREQIATYLQPTLSRCANDWNQLRSVSRPPVHNVSSVSLGTTRRIIATGFGFEARPPVWAHYCRYAFVENQRVVIVLGLWQHGGIDRWSISVDPHADRVAEGNATLQRSGRVRLLNHNGRLVLSS
jgi:hypothetical protein